MDNKSEGKQCFRSNDQNVDQMSEKIEKNVESQQMAVESQKPSTSSNWWNSWVQKSSETFESIKRDLNEFKETVQNDTISGLGVVSNTASYVSQTMRDTITGISYSVAPDEGEGERQQSPQPDPHKDCSESTGDDIGNRVSDEDSKDDNPSDDWALNLTNKAKHKLTELMGSIADAFVMNRNYLEEEDQMYVLSGDKLVAIDRWEQLLAEVQTDPNTYCREPSGPPEHYESWLMTFCLIDYQRQMDQMLQTVPQMQQFYSQLVPNSLSDVDFWHRFYYRVHQLRENERKKIEDKSNQSTDPKETTEESTNWNRNKNSVEIRLLEENSGSFESEQLKRELLSIATNECPDMQSGNDLTSTPDLSDTQKSDTGSDDWEKTDVVVSDEDKDWVECE